MQDFKTRNIASENGKKIKDERVQLILTPYFTKEKMFPFREKCLIASILGKIACFEYGKSMEVGKRKFSFRYNRDVDDLHELPDLITINETPNDNERKVDAELANNFTLVLLNENNYKNFEVPKKVYDSLHKIPSFSNSNINDKVFHNLLNYFFEYSFDNFDDNVKRCIIKQLDENCSYKEVRDLTIDKVMTELEDRRKVEYFENNIGEELSF